MNKPVSFELAKLLKEKGFNILTYNYYKEKDYYYKEELITPKGTLLQNEDWPYNVSTQQIHAPTIAEVVMWLYEKHGIWISVHEENCRGYVGFDFNIVFVGDHETTVTQQEIQYKLLGETVFNSPTEAYEAAIEYVLTKLI